jgi:signal transduction histidine kinase
VQHEAERQRRWIEATLQQLPIGVIIAEAPGGATVLVNEIARHITQYSFEQSVEIEQYNQFQNFAGLRPDGRPYAPEEWPLARALRTGEVVTDEEVIIRRFDGSEITIEADATPIRDDHGAIVAAVVTFSDITARRHSELLRARLVTLSDALARILSEEQVVNVVLDQAVPSFGADAGTVVLATAQGTRFSLLGSVGFDQDELRNWRSYPIRHATPAGQAALTAAPVFVGSNAELLQRFPSLAGLPLARHYAAHASLPMLFEGTVLGVISFNFSQPRTFDTEERLLMQTFAQQCGQAFERARLYEDQQISRAEAEAAVHLRDIFFSVAAHELKTPLTSLMGQAQLLQRRLDREGLLQGTLQHSVDVVIAQAQRLNAMVSALLDLSRIEQGRLSIEREPLDLCALVQRVIEETLPTIRRHDLVCKVDEAPIMIFGDALRLEQVLQNLIGNAVKYSPNGGEVRVRVVRQEDGFARIDVQDHGIGIPEDALPHLFSRFYRAPNAVAGQISGTGIGLYVVKEIVALHGGRVGVASSQGTGATFSITLPPLESVSSLSAQPSALSPQS